MHPSRASAFALVSIARVPTRSASLIHAVLAGLLIAVSASAAQAAPEITTATLPGATAGSAYSTTLQATNGTSPYTWTVADGSLPSGLGLDGGTGEISGTSNPAATTGFVVLVTDAVGDTASKAFSITVSAAAPAALSFEVQPSDVVAGVAIAPAVQVKVADAFGNGVAGESVSLSLTGTGVLTGGGAVVSDAGGLATFSSLSVDVQGSKQLSAASGALTPVSSASFTVSAAAPAALSFEVQPSDVVAGVAIAPAVQVKVADAFGNGVAGESVSLSLTGTGVLTGGGAVVSDAGGLATFSSLSVDVQGSKQLSAASGALTPVSSASFTVSAAAPAALSFEVQPSDVVAGVAIAPAVQVKVADAFGNGVAGESVSLSLTGTGVLTGGGAVVSDAGGLATFSSLSVDVQGSKQLAATSGVLGPVASASFTVSCPIVSVSPASLPNGSVSVSYAQTLVGSGGVGPYAYTVSAGALPGGLTLDPGGSLSGTPTTNGQFDFTVLATDVNGCTGSRAYSVLVCGTVVVSPAVLPDAQANVSYSQSLSGSGGVAPYTFAITTGALPSGLTLSPAGLVSGTPTTTGVFNFTVLSTSAGGCSGATAITLTVPGVPVAASDLAVTRQTTGNDADGTSLMLITFTPSAFTSSVEVYRAPFGGYPRYDDAGGLVPPTPSYPPGSPWVLTGVTASGQTDDPPQRDAWSYVVFFKNSFGQVSAVSNKTPTRPNYALGDVSNGLVAGAGDNAVDDLDISLLGAHYGISGSALTSADVHYLDVGPTTDFLVTSRPFTDIRLDFEDLIVCATNYGAVSSPATIVAGADAAARAARGAERVKLQAPSLVEAAQVFEVSLDMEAAGRVQGLSAVLAWDPSVVEPVSSSSTGWVESQKGVVWSSAPGVVDAALLGARSVGLRGQGTLARITFRARRIGDPAIRLGQLLARDAANRPIADGLLTYGTRAEIPARTLLLAPSPNPGSGPTAVTFALSQAGDAELSIFSVDGRRVRTLASGPFEPGSYHFTWNGDDELRRDVAPGVYYAQLITQGRRFSRTIVHLR